MGWKVKVSDPIHYLGLWAPDWRGKQCVCYVGHPAPVVAGWESMIEAKLTVDPSLVSPWNVAKGRREHLCVIELLLVDSTIKVADGPECPKVMFLINLYPVPSTGVIEFKLTPAAVVLYRLDNCSEFDGCQVTSKGIASWTLTRSVNPPNGKEVMIVSAETDTEKLAKQLLAVETLYYANHEIVGVDDRTLEMYGDLAYQLRDVTVDHCKSKLWPFHGPYPNGHPAGTLVPTTPAAKKALNQEKGEDEPPLDIKIKDPGMGTRKERTSMVSPGDGLTASAGAQRASLGEFLAELAVRDEPSPRRRGL